MILFSSVVCPTRGTPNVSHVREKVGSHTYGEVILDSLEMLGIAKLHGTKISKLLKLTGNLIACSACLNQVEVEGDVRLTETNVEGQMQITGSLQARGSSFQGSLLFTGQKAVFSNCKLSAITVKRDAGFRAKQLIELKDRTIVDGSIIFENQGGLVFLFAGSKILGSVSGGQIIQKN